MVFSKFGQTGSHFAMMSLYNTPLQPILFVSINLHVPLLSFSWYLKMEGHSQIYFVPFNNLSPPGLFGPPDNC